MNAIVAATGPNIRPIEPEILAALDAPGGLVLIGGPTGSGRTVLVGDLNRLRLATPGIGCRLHELNFVQENVYDEILAPDAVCRHINVERSMNGDQAGEVSGLLREAMRSGATDIALNEPWMLGENKQAVVDATAAGCRVIATLLGDGAAGTVDRLLLETGDTAAAIALVRQLRLVIGQKLFPTLDKRGLIAIREILVMTDALREALIAASPASWFALTQAEVQAQNQTFKQKVIRAIEQGLISHEEAARQVSLS